MAGDLFRRQLTRRTFLAGAGAALGACGVSAAPVFVADAEPTSPAVSVRKVYVEDFRNGTRTDNQVLDAAFAAVGAGGEVVFGQGATYTLTAGVVADLTAKPGVTINGQGATITGGTGYQLLQVRGTDVTAGSRPTLTAAITKPNNTIRVSSTAGIQSGDLVFFYSDTEYFDTDTACGGEVKRELHRVESVLDATTLQLSSWTKDSYSLTGHVVTCRVFRPMRNITVKDLTMQSPDRTTAGQVGLSCQFFDQLTLDNVRVDGFTLCGLQAYGGMGVNFIGCRATNCSVEDFAVSGSDSNNGYGLWTIACQGSRYIGCSGKRNRHSIEVHQSRDVVVSGCTVEDDRSSGISTHGMEQVTITDNTVRNCGGGIVVRTADNVISRNRILGVHFDGGQSYGHGIYVGLQVPDSSRPNGYAGHSGRNLSVTDNVVDMSGWPYTVADINPQAIQIEAPLDNAQITGNQLMGFPRQGINCRGYTLGDGWANRNAIIGWNGIDCSAQQNLADGSTNRPAISISPLNLNGAPALTDAGVASTAISIVNNAIDAGRPDVGVYVYGGRTSSHVSTNIRVAENVIPSASTAGVFLDQYFGSGIQVFDNVVDPGTDDISYDPAKFASPLVTSPPPTTDPQGPANGEPRPEGG